LPVDNNFKILPFSNQQVPLYTNQGRCQGLSGSVVKKQHT